MRSASLCTVVGAALWLVSVCPLAAAGQLTSSGVEVTAELSTDTVEVGEPFELRVAFTVGPNEVAYFPDSLPGGRRFESLRPVEWSVAQSPDGTHTVALSYELMAFDFGTITVPEFAILTVPASAVPFDEGPVGTWGNLEVRPELASSLTARVVPSRSVWVPTVLVSEELEQSPVPRPPDDVVGSSWHWSAVVFSFLFGTLLAGVVVVSARDWMALQRSKRTPVTVAAVDPIEAARRAALEALDELLRLGFHTKGRVDEFYRRSSGAVRGYVEQLSPTWGPAHTSTELMHDLEEEAGGDAAPDLLREMEIAEFVKFGRLRPDAPSAETHWGTLRDWVAESGTAQPEPAVETEPFES